MLGQEQSAIDLTFVSNSLAGVCMWDTDKRTVMGSDHYPIKPENNQVEGNGKLIFNKAEWKKF